ncbi:HemK/PrmC family methyltransferase [Raineyella sp. LH-20]|uniref:N5-glutamine methyltransferase family protein n=1 Tax=Raineyella sp. LH-20 TaxID=3081204 RepID=UPI002952FCA9|nr:HemK/PrmC family methyltransferase [Raineyella sp. LH-20]WOP17381.1 HemK/PrmC family methyltransferase [Raineyella sp. LH-20]
MRARAAVPRLGPTALGGGPYTRGIDLDASSPSARPHLDLLRRTGSVFAEDELSALAAAAADADDLTVLVASRAEGVPIEVLVGYARFGELRIAVAPGVFVPRHRTEYLVERAGRRVRPGDTVLDLGCGTGAVGALIGHRVPGLALTAMDADPVAVACARGNLPPSARVVCGDSPALLAPARFRVIVANLPYVPSSRIAYLPHDARDWEPLQALDGGPDGLDPLRRVAPDLPARLVPGGWFLLELAADQVETARTVLTAAGFAASAVGVADDGETWVLEAQR